MKIPKIQAWSEKKLKYSNEWNKKCVIRLKQERSLNSDVNATFLTNTANLSRLKPHVDHYDCKHVFHMANVLKRSSI